MTLRPFRPIALIVPIALLLTLISAIPAAARPDCGVPDPPPICGPRQTPPESHVIGAFESAAVVQQNGVKFRGWALDPRNASSVEVLISIAVVIDGQRYWARTQLAAMDNRPDVGSAYPTSGAMHGFSYWWTHGSATAGSHIACVDAFDPGTKTWIPFGCKPFTGT